jgi:opacity protein-like surface antigen
MHPSRIVTLACCLFALATLPASAARAAGPDAHSFEVSVSSGAIVLNQNDTALPDNFVNVPFTAAATYHINPMFALEGECSWYMGIKQDIDLRSGQTVQRKTPESLTYQANLVATLPLRNARWSPFLTVGAGAMTFVSNTDKERLPQLKDSQTMFAMNMGAGVSYHLTRNWLVRTDFREFAAFPLEDAEGLSTSGSADPIWSERVSAGIGYRF